MSDRRRLRRTHPAGGIYLVVGALLLLLFALLALGSRQLSFTADEPAYIAGGYALLARGQEAFALLPQRGYPPLLGALEASLIYLATPDIPLEQLAGWPAAFDPFTHAFQTYLLPLERAEMVTRLPIVLLTVILAAVVFRWGKELWGSKAGLLALVALVFDPMLLAHGRLATTDAGTVALGTAALYGLWHWTENPSWRWALGTGTLLGLTMLAKVSGLLWTITVGLIVLWTALRWRRVGRSVQILAQGIVLGGLSLLILWAGYGFTWGSVPGLPFPLPAPAHWESWRYLDQYTSEVFALGQRTYGRWWWYFPLAFLIKNPLPLLIGGAIGLMVLLRGAPSRSRILILSLFPLLYTAIALGEGMSIGYRHMLPIHPFMYLIVGGGLAKWGWGQPTRLWQRALLGLLALWYVTGTLRVFPSELAYFNELVGGTAGGYRYLADSNLDWGQSAKALQAYLEAHPGARAEPPAARFRPAPGRYVVSASYLQGLGIGDPYAYEWFRHWEPQAILNASLLVYDVPPFDTSWIAQCARPAMPLNEASIARGLGASALRQVGFNCTQAWLYPDGGATPGIYALHHDLIEQPGLCLPTLLPCPSVPDDPFVARHLAQARLSFEQAHGGQLPAFALYEMASAPVEPLYSSAVYVGSVETLPAQLNASPPLSAPLTLDDTFAFLGTAAYLEEDALEVETWWRVVDPDGPITRPFSIMAHLLSSEGETLGTADGLGVWPLTLAAGDVAVQRHRFPHPPEGAEVWLRTGAYWGDSLARWKVPGVPGADALFIRLDKITILD